MSTVRQDLKCQMVVSFRCAGSRPKMNGKQARFAFLEQSAAGRCRVGCPAEGKVNNRASGLVYIGKEQ